MAITSAELDRLRRGDMFTADDLAALLHVHRNTLLRYVRTNHVRTVRVGKAKLIDGADFAALLGIDKPAPPRSAVDELAARLRVVG